MITPAPEAIRPRAAPGKGCPIRTRARPGIGTGFIFRGLHFLVAQKIQAKNLLPALLSTVVRGFLPGFMRILS